MNSGYDLLAWARARFGVRNEGGGRGFDHGIIVFDCNFCDDATVGGARGYINLERVRAGCLNAGCQVQQAGGVWAPEYVRAVEGFRTRAEAVAWLRAEYPATRPWLPPKPPATYADWCTLPESRPLREHPGPRPGVSHDEARAFLWRQWGLRSADAARWGLRYCVQGRYAFRVLIPITLGGRLVAFQARSYRGGEPKYLTSAHGKRGEPGAECGRPAEALLFGLDAVEEGRDVVIVEGAGDAMRWEAGRGYRLDRAGDGDSPEYAGDCRWPVPVAACHGAGPVGVAPAPGGGPAGVADGVVTGAELAGARAVGLLGTVCTEEKAALLAARGPGRVIVALDAEPEVAPAQAAVAARLRDWGLDVAEGLWVGGKDAGSGAVLEVAEPRGLRALAARRMER